MKIALFFSGNYIRRYEIEELINLLKTKNKFLFFFYKQKKIIKRSKKKILFDFFLTHGFFSLVLLEQKFAEIIGHKNSFYKKIKKMLKKIELNTFVKNYDKYEKFNFKTKKNKGRHIFDKSTIDKIIDKNVNLIIFLGFNKLIDVKMLNLVKGGILSFHTADTNKYKGRPSAFYEFLNNEKFGGVTLQRLSTKIDGGEIIGIKKRNISKCKSYDETRYRMLKLKKKMLVDGVNKIKLKKTFLKPKKTVLNKEKDSKNFSLVMKCIFKTLRKRYFF
jgi:folate-dependent phosphoribosylglycinamide formyltransferase PurN